MHLVKHLDYYEIFNNSQKICSYYDCSEKNTSYDYEVSFQINNSDIPLIELDETGFMVRLLSFLTLEEKQSIRKAHEELFNESIFVAIKRH